MQVSRALPYDQARLSELSQGADPNTEPQTTHAASQPKRAAFNKPNPFQVACDSRLTLHTQK